MRKLKGPPLENCDDCGRLAIVCAGVEGYGENYVYLCLWCADRLHALAKEAFDAAQDPQMRERLSE